MNVKFFDPSRGYKRIRKEVLGEIDRVLKAGDLILRQDVEDFENTLAEYVGTKYAVALNSGTDALYLALRALKIGRGDQVIVPSRTFVATAQVVKQVGAEPIFYDLDGKVTAKPDRVKAIIPVHIEGAMDRYTNDMIGWAEINGWDVIEDAAQAIGATHDGKMAGSLGTAGCFSFYPAKILGAYGDAGGLTTNNKEIYEYVKDARNHFKDSNSDWGVNSRMDNVQAAILNVKFRYHQQALDRRQEIAEMYDTGLCKIEDLILPPSIEGRVWQDYIIRTTDRNDLFAYLKREGVETMKNNYPFPVPKLPQAQAYEDETLRLPCNENVEDKEIKYVIKIIKQFYENTYNRG